MLTAINQETKPKGPSKLENALTAMNIANSFGKIANAGYDLVQGMGKVQDLNPGYEAGTFSLTQQPTDPLVTRYSGTWRNPLLEDLAARNLAQIRVK